MVALLWRWFDVLDRRLADEFRIDLLVRSCILLSLAMEASSETGATFGPQGWALRKHSAPSLALLACLKHRGANTGNAHI